MSKTSSNRFGESLIMWTSFDVYSEAKKALNASGGERVVCRSKENGELENHFISCFEDNKPLSIYVNGQPGRLLKKYSSNK